MPEKQILAKKTYVDNNLNNVVRNVNGVVSIPNTQIELSQKIVTTTEEDPDTHEEITTDEVVTESYLYKNKLHLENSYEQKVAEFGPNEIVLNGSTITGITDNASGNSSTLAVSQRALSNFKQVEANPVGQATADLTTIKIDNTIYELDAGTNVSITPTISSGAKIADYSIDGVSGELYAPIDGDAPIRPILVGSTYNTDSAGSKVFYDVYSGTEQLTLNNFFKDLTAYNFFVGGGRYTCSTNFTSYTDNDLYFSWTTQAGSTQQWFDVYIVEDLDLVNVLSDWTLYNTDGDYTFTVPDNVDAGSIIIDFRNVTSGGVDMSKSNVTKTVVNNVLTVHFPFPNQTVSLEARILYLKKKKDIIPNPPDTPTDELDSIKIEGITYEVGGDNSVELTTAEYNALPQSEKMNGTTYLLTNANADGDGFTPSLYLKSHGTEFIKTGVMPTEKIDYEFEFFFDRDQVEDSSITGWHNQFGGNDGNTTNSILFSYNFSTHYLTFQKGNNPAFQDVFYKFGPRCVYKIVNKGGNHWINGVSQTNDFGTTSFTGTNNDIAIFGSNTSPSGGKGICLIRCKIYDNNVLIRDFIPNENNGTPCLYDQINNVYYTNQGTGSFEIGYIDDIITSNANENNQIDYSLIEQRTGQRWINGKPIYQKTIYYAGGSSGGRYNIPHGISNLDKLIYLEGFYTDSSGDNPHMILPRIATDGYHIGINSADNTYITMTFSTVWGSRLTDVYITIRYTKTTD